MPWSNGSQLLGTEGAGRAPWLAWLRMWSRWWREAREIVRARGCVPARRDNASRLPLDVSVVKERGFEARAEVRTLQPVG